MFPWPLRPRTYIHNSVMEKLAKTVLVPEYTWVCGFCFLKKLFFTLYKIIGIKFHFTIPSHVKYKWLMLERKVIFKRKMMSNAGSNSVWSADLKVMVTLGKWDKIDGLGGKESILASCLWILESSQKLIPFLVEK